MSTQVKIVIAAINIACLIVTLLFPADVTPLVLLTTIASTASWAFTTQEKTKDGQKGLLIYTSLASILAIVCIVLGVTSSIIRPDPCNNPGLYVFSFDSTLVGLAKVTINYLYFAIPMFLLIVFLMSIEIGSSLIKEKAQNIKENETIPIAKNIKQQLAKVKPGKP